MEIEVYPSSTTASQEEFKELLKSEFSKNKNLEEGAVLECTKKITDNFCYLSADGLSKSLS